MHTVHIRVRGRVQGVGYRAFVSQTARQFGVLGVVWNTGDGAVEAIAQAAMPDALDRFVHELYSGPGRVESVEVERRSESRSYVGFSISG